MIKVLDNRFYAKFMQLEIGLFQDTFSVSVADEAAGLIKGLAEVVKSQQSVQQHALQQTADQLQTLSHTVASLTQNLPSSSVLSFTSLYWP